jgi:hypothetical protein
VMIVTGFFIGASCQTMEEGMNKRSYSAIEPVQWVYYLQATWGCAHHLFSTK